jgi:hypothetical protein
MDLWDTLDKFLLILVTSLVTTHLAFHRFRKERLWEYKARNYEKILECLYYIKKYIDFEYEEYEADQNQNWQNNEEYYKYDKARQEEKSSPENIRLKTELKTKLDQARSRLDKIIGITELIVDENVSVELEKISKQLWGLEHEDESDDEGYERTWNSIRSCIKSIKQQRRNDLEDKNLLTKYLDKICISFKDFFLYLQNRIKKR